MVEETKCESPEPIGRDAIRGKRLAAAVTRGPDEELINLAYERGQLGERIAKLETVIKVDPPAVPDNHKQLWKDQLTAMKTYYNVLGARMGDFINQSQKT